MLRTGLLTIALGASSWFQFGQARSAAELMIFGRDLFDGRPAHSVLFLGNSRTYYHHMPDMVRAIADAAGDPEKYQVVVVAEPGASFESLAGEANVRRVAAERWDDVILQGESRGQTSARQAHSFQVYGETLARMVHPVRNRPWLVINWSYDPSVYINPAIDRPAHTDRVRTAHHDLSRAANLDEIDVSAIWERVRNDHPEIQLTEDGNHPTLAGSYLVALLIYSTLSHSSTAELSYIPDGLDPDQAATIRYAVAKGA